MKTLLVFLIATFLSINIYGQLEIKTFKEVRLLDCPGIEYGELVELIPKGKTVLLTDYSRDFYTAKYNGKEGFIYYVFLGFSKRLDDFKSEKQQLNKNKEYVSCGLLKLQKTYPKEIAERILRKEVWIGMSGQMALDVLGRPKNINKSLVGGIMTEQWVYENKYLYFESGSLKSIQESQ